MYKITLPEPGVLMVIRLVKSSNSIESVMRGKVDER